MPQVDLLYLHNAAEAQLAIVGRENFTEKLLLAFKFLEGVTREVAVFGSGGNERSDAWTTSPLHPTPSTLHRSTLQGADPELWPRHVGLLQVGGIMWRGW